MRKGDFMNKSIDICTKVIYNIDNSKSPLCILRNYTRAKMQGSKTRSFLYRKFFVNYTRAKLQGSKTFLRSYFLFFFILNYTRAELQGSKTTYGLHQCRFENYTRAKSQGSKTELLTRRLKA